MKVWRIGSNWDNENILSLFKEYNIAFAGEGVEDNVGNVKQNDILVITNGQPVVAIGRIKGLVDLSSIKEEFATKYADVSAIEIEPLFFAENSNIDFGYYGGQGKQFHEAHGEYRTTFLHLFKLLNKNMQQEKIKELLKYKKQIILQGPPGTGKTFTAEAIAEEMTKQPIITQPLNIINAFFKGRTKPTEEVLHIRAELENYLAEFQNEFKKEDIKNLSLDKYAFGKKDNDSFCYWLEYVLYDLGRYTGQAGKFKIYWKKEIEAYTKSGFIKDIQDDNEAMKQIALQLDNVVNERDLTDTAEKLSNGFILKVLHSYYPDKYFPINNEKCITNGLKLMGKKTDGLNVFDKNILLQKAFIEKKAEFNADVENYEFMRFLFNTFDMKGNISLQDEKLISKGEYKIIQFHPAYSYEDFVRGISAEPKGANQVEYKVVNRVLADFAQKAIDNPSANYLLIIDEINRANLPAVLGELIYALEYRYDPDATKKNSVESIYAIKESEDDEIGNKELKLPLNLFIIGTMNTADRSVGHIDYAIRRRFAFVDIEPSDTVIEEVIKDGQLKAKAKTLYARVADFFKDGNIAPDFKANDVQIGHSYFLVKTENELSLKLEYEIKPLLLEYVKDGILKSDIIFGNSTNSEESIKNLKV